MNTRTPKLADEPTLADGTPNESRIDALKLLLTSSGQEL